MKKITQLLVLLVMQINFAQNKISDSGNIGIGTNNPSVPLDVIGTVKIQSSNSNYNENLRLLPSLTGDYSSLALGAVSGNSGTGIGQWTLLRYPAADNYMFSLRYNSTDFFNIKSNGNVGIGTQNPDSKLTVEGNINARSITINSGLNNTLSRPPLTSGTSEYGEIRAYSMHGNSMDDGFLRICAGGGTTQWAKTYIDISGYSTVPDMDRNIVFGTSSLERMRIMDSGNVGIGTSAPDSKLTVAGNIHAQEVKVTLRAGEVPDYVFAIDYKLKSLNEVEQYIRENSHLPEIPSAQEIEKNGLMLAEMNMNLLKKIEELTLYMIEIKKENLEMKKKQVELEKQVKNLSSQ